MNVQEKLLDVQLKLKAPKNQYNIFGKYNYRNCEDIQEAAKPLMREVNALLMVGDKLVQIGDRFYVEATARFIDCESLEELNNTAYAREELEKKGMDASQITGCASSYARKYALNGLFCIDDVKDSDSQDNADKKKSDESKTTSGKKQTESFKLSKTQSSDLYKELARTGVGKSGLLKYYNVTTFETMTLDQYTSAMKSLKGKPDKAVDPATIPPENPDNGLPWK
jgi:hypothetical protein